MKKLFALILAITLMASLTVTAFADTAIGPNTEDKTGALEVSFNVDPTFTVTIPATVELKKEGSNYVSDYTITADAGVRLKKGETIVITVASNYEMTTAQGAKLPYTITQGNNTITAENNVVATFTTDTNAQSSTIHIAAADPRFAGEYKDTVTFTIAVVSAPSAPATISFTIDGVTYQADAGMTWGAWAASAYNVDGFVENEGGIFSYGVVCYGDFDYFMEYGGVSTSDVIEAGHDYSKLSF